MELGLENFYPRGIFVSKKSDESKGAKKKYALIDENNNIKITGFETVRRDWSKLARETQKKILKIILEEDNPRKAFDYAIDMDPYLNVSACLTRMLGKKTIGFANQYRSCLFDFSVPFNDKQHMSQTWADLLSPLSMHVKVKELLPLQYSKEDIAQVKLFLKQHGIKSHYVCLCTSCAESAKHRSWPYFGELIGWLNYYKIPVILIGSPSERKELMRLTNVNHAAISACKLTLHQTAYLLKNARLMVSNDTGPMHLATCMDTPTIGLFGGNLPLRYRPLNEKSKSITKALSCSPCINTHLSSFKECNDPQCMKLISISDVIKEVYPYVQDLIV